MDQRQIIRKAHGKVDDVFITCDSVHLEKMSDDAWWLGVYRGDYCTSFWISRRGRRIEVEVQNDELECVDDS